MDNYSREESKQIMKLKVCHVNDVVLVNYQPVVYEWKRTLNVDILAPTARLFSLQFAILCIVHTVVQVSLSIQEMNYRHFIREIMEYNGVNTH